MEGSNHLEFFLITFPNIFYKLFPRSTCELNAIDSGDVPSGLTWNLLHSKKGVGDILTLLSIYHSLFHVKCSKWLYSESNGKLSFTHACFCIRGEHANSIANWALSKCPRWDKLSKVTSNKTSDCLLSLGRFCHWLEYILTTQWCESTFPVRVFKRVAGSGVSPSRSQSVLAVCHCVKAWLHLRKCRASD